MNYVDYSSTRFGIVLKYLPSWHVDIIKNGIQIKSTNESSYIEIRVNKEQGLVNLKDYALKDIADRKDSRNFFKLIENISPATIDELTFKGYKAKYSFSTEGDLKKRFLDIGLFRKIRYIH